MAGNDSRCRLLEGLILLCHPACVYVCLGPIFGVPSSAMMHKPLHFWLGVPTTYDGLLLEAKKKGGALKKKVADAKTGPLFHVSGQHFDGDRVKVAVQVR